MKFLDGVTDNNNIMPLNIYYNRGEYRVSDDDYIDIIYKDIDTGKKYVQTINNPEIEVWITKKEFRTYKHIRDFMPKEECSKYKVKYKTRFREIGKILGISEYDAKYSPYIFNADINIEHFYLIQFIQEYKNDKVKKLSMGYLDIENDILRVDGFPSPGEAPINAVTFIDESRLQVYTLVLKADNIPDVPESHKKWSHYNNLREKFWENFTAFENDIDGFIQQCHDTFDEAYGVLDYNILIFDKEIDLIRVLFEIIRASENDYIDIWNSPYDMQNLIERPRQLGYDPNDIIVDKRFCNRQVLFKEDRNALEHKRKHICNTYTMQTYVDQMVIYAGVRSAKGKIPSLKLNAIAKKELGDSKLDYSEEGNIKYFPYYNFAKFVLYNIKDVLLQMGINRKTHDMDTFYNTIYTNCVLPHEVFTSTYLIVNSLRNFVFTFSKGYVLGSNKNRWIDKQVNYAKILPGLVQQMEVNESNEDNFNVNDILFTDDEDTDTEDDEDTKYQGAFVMNSLHMSSSGYKLLGRESQLVHRSVVDMDIGSEYPTAMLIMNSSNETLVCKVFLDKPEKFDIPIYEEFNFIGKEEAKYKLDVSNFMLEVYSQNDVLNFAHIFLNLPDISTIFNEIDSSINKFYKK